MNEVNESRHRGIDALWMNEKSFQLMAKNEKFQRIFILDEVLTYLMNLMISYFYAASFSFFGWAFCIYSVENPLGMKLMFIVFARRQTTASSEARVELLHQRREKTRECLHTYFISFLSLRTLLPSTEKGNYSFIRLAFSL